jgi:hypothetical protein
MFKEKIGWSANHKDNETVPCLSNREIENVQPEPKQVKNLNIMKRTTVLQRHKHKTRTLENLTHKKGLLTHKSPFARQLRLKYVSS